MHLNLCTINKDNDKETKIHMFKYFASKVIISAKKTKYTLIYREY